jgi:hypothetical protein
MSRYETYAWLPDPTGGDPRVQNEILAERVRAAVDAELAKKGFTLVTSGTPHFLIGWFSYYGYGWGPWYGAAYGQTYVRYYE